MRDTNLELYYKSRVSVTRSAETGRLAHGLEASVISFERMRALGERAAWAYRRYGNVAAFRSGFGMIPATRGNGGLMSARFGGARAAGYDSAFGSISGQFIPCLLAAASVGPGHLVLDVATGTSVAAEAASKAVGPRGSVVATDLSQPCSRERASVLARRGTFPSLSRMASRSAFPISSSTQCYAPWDSCCFRIRRAASRRSGHARRPVAILPRGWLCRINTEEATESAGDPREGSHRRFARE
jgi:hypothetical protein